MVFLTAFDVVGVGVDGQPLVWIWSNAIPVDAVDVTQPTIVLDENAAIADVLEQLKVKTLQTGLIDVQRRSNTTSSSSSSSFIVSFPCYAQVGRFPTIKLLQLVLSNAHSFFSPRDFKSCRTH